jgi:hypothetical protein
VREPSHSLWFGLPSCVGSISGGPEIAFRAGRIDATEPNSPGVPEPHQDIDSHISAFARLGFSQDEMIGLVACGHSFGSVQHSAFPYTVPGNADPTVETGATFDTTFDHFDNNVLVKIQIPRCELPLSSLYRAKEYMDGTTQNPLVVGHNDTTNSDKRIFQSDGNITMSS